tara:strand:- start:96 stop:941 length:846 start_codon:yes stop_codon:yes gene_type:complete
MVVQSSVRLYLESEKPYKSYSDCHKEYRLDKHIRARDNHVIQIELLDAEIPVSFYAINSNNNELKVTVGGVQSTLMLDPGNYSATEVRDIFNTTYLTQVVATYIPASNRFSFQGTGAWSFAAAKGNYVFGVADAGQTSDSLHKVVSTRMVNLAGLNNIFIKVVNVNLENLDSHGKESGILAKIVVDQGFGGLVHFEDYHHALNLLKETNINNIELKMVDLDGRPVGGDTGFNGVPWSLTLMFNFLPKEEIDVSGRDMLDKLNTLLENQKVKRTGKQNTGKE